VITLIILLFTWNDLDMEDILYTIVIDSFLLMGIYSFYMACSLFF
jgi:hypothetical protein